MFKATLIFTLAFNTVLGLSQTQSQGKVFWRGTVDDKVQLVISGDKIETKTISGRPNNDAVFSFVSYLPRQAVNVNVNKKEGRSRRITVIQQPNRDNDYTAIIEIHDDSGGPDVYLLEIYW
ncbi:MAG TPA: hypothetical protein VNK26_03665 [Pyrinomonadaceae bacterium]|jgi:hypothetical protein|nr:hypothetical protein [Pyrinomonadaceae bacterium]